MKEPVSVLDKFEKYIPIVADEMKTVLDEQEDFLMYDMFRYALGFKDEKLNDTRGYGGKRFRSGLTLLLSDFYGALEKAKEIASSIEIFHNFTLIHDDIEDHDPLRRGRPTVWKIWGEVQAINTGDAGMMLSNIELIKGVKKHGFGPEVYEFLNKTYLLIAEGQFMDLYMSDLSIDSAEVTEEKYLEMIGKKSATLVAASARVAGMIAGKTEEEQKALWDYGYNLGLAYQLNDDLLSIWGNIESTGKIEASDLEERKKTLPIIHLYHRLPKENKKSFSDIYNKEGNLSHTEISMLKNYLHEIEAHEYVWGMIKDCLAKSEAAIAQLTLSDEEKDILNKINQALIPDVKFWDA